MDAKISQLVWSDPDLDDRAGEVLLTLLWCKTNPARNDCGAYRFSAARFTMETRLAAEWHAKTLAALPASFATDGHWVLYIPFIRECLQLGEITGRNGGINKGAQALAKPFQSLPMPFQNLLLDTYPEFAPVFRKPLGSPCQGLGQKEGHGKPFASPSGADSQSVTEAESGKTAAESEGLAKPLASPRAEQSRAEQSRAESGESEGGGVAIPSEVDVLGFARSYRSLLDGWSGIPEAYALRWLAWRMTPKAGPFPKNWRADLSFRFRAHVLDGQETPTSLAALKNGPASADAKLLAELERAFAKAETPDERAELRKQIEPLRAKTAA